MTRTQRTFILRFIWAVLLIGLWNAGSNVQAQSTPPSTIVDYFLHLPQRYFEITQSERADSLFGKYRGAGIIIDVKNDYLYFPGDGAQPPLTVALFRDHGRVLAAVLDGGYDPAIPTLDFLRYTHGRWMNVTKIVLPLPFNNRLTYLLPRHGTTIRVRNSHGDKVYDLWWRDGGFHVV